MNIKTLFMLLLLPTLSFAQDFNIDLNKKIDLPTPKMDKSKAIFGDNSMNDYYQVSPLLKSMADSTVAFIKKDNLVFDTNTNTYTPKKTLKVLNQYIDPNEDFASQNTLSFCSGAYVGKGYILSAGHCISDKDYKDAYIVFGWRYENTNTPVTSFPLDQVYTISKIEKRALDQGNGDSLNEYQDYSLSVLDRIPTNKKPLSVEKDSLPSVGEKVFTIGYPLGMAVKIDNPNDAQIFLTGKNTFQTNIDAFGGNSGGPVFNSQSKKIIGILVTGSGGEFSYELNNDTNFSLKVDKDLKGEIEIDSNKKTLKVKPDVLNYLLSLLRNYKVKTYIIDSESYLIIMNKGTKLGNRELMFQVIISLNGVEVFNKGKLIREEQQSYGTGIMKVPQEIKDLI